MKCTRKKHHFRALSDAWANSISQAKQFADVTKVTGLVLTKIDGTAKGGFVIGICSEMEIPVKYIGVGEKIEDLQKFNSKDFANALFEGSESSKNEE